MQLMIEETKTEETIGFFAIFLSMMAFQLGEAGASCPPTFATPMPVAAGTN